MLYEVITELADIARVHGAELIAKDKLTSHQKKVMTAIRNNFV